MMKILAKPWELLKALFGLAFPMFRSGGTATAGSPGAWVARGVLLAVILAGLTCSTSGSGWHCGT